MSDRRPLGAAVSAVEGFFDRLKLGYKWRFNRWQHLGVTEYLGYGTPSAVLLHGRVLDDEPVTVREDSGTWTDLLGNIRRIETDEVPGAAVRLRLGGESRDSVTDGDGFFRVWFHDPPLTGQGPWYRGRATLVKPKGHAAEADLTCFVPNDRTTFVVVSDLDDTVIRTGATSPLKMFRVVLLNSPTSRVPFPGVAAFYCGLARGPTVTAAIPSSMSRAARGTSTACSASF